MRSSGVTPLPLKLADQNEGFSPQLGCSCSKAIEFHERALAIDETLNGRASHLGNLGNCYGRLGDILKAIDSFERCLALFEAMGLPHASSQSRIPRPIAGALGVDLPDLFTFKDRETPRDKAVERLLAVVRRRPPRTSTW